MPLNLNNFPVQNGAVLIQHPEIKITCKYCGVEDFAHVKNGKGPHAYEALCAHCCKHHKWMSKYDVEKFTREELLATLIALDEKIRSEISYGKLVILEIDRNKIEKKLEQMQ